MDPLKPFFVPDFYESGGGKGGYEVLKQRRFDRLRVQIRGLHPFMRPNKEVHPFTAFESALRSPEGRKRGQCLLWTINNAKVAKVDRERRGAKGET